MALPISKSPKKGNSKVDEYVAKYQSEFESASIVFAKIAGYDTPEQYYNPRSNLLALSHRSNIYWAYLIGATHVFPQPGLHDVLWLRLKKVDEVPLNKAIPDEVPDTMSVSVAFLIPRLDQPNLVDSASLAGMDSNYGRDNQEDQKIYEGRKSDAAHQRTGLVFNNKSGGVLLKGPGSEILLSDEGIHIDGPIHNHDMSQKGIFEENPLAFIVPDTIVTFPVAMKFLPDLDKIASIGELVADLESIESIISAVNEI